MTLPHVHACAGGSRLSCPPDRPCGRPKVNIAGHWRSVLAILVCLWALPLRAQPLSVDVRIVLAVDASGSVDRDELKLQIGGIAAAFRDRAVQDAARAGPQQRIAAAVLIWSDASYPKYPTSWHILQSPASFEAFAREIEAFNISAPGVPAIGGGGTNIGDALAYAITMIRENELLATRDVVDISGDGPESKPWVDGAIELPAARALARRHAITVNGLAIETDIADLRLWYRHNVIVGPGSFVEHARDFDDYQRAIIEKLLRELSAVQIATR